MQPTQVQDVTRNDEVLAVSLELASKSWKVGLDDGKRNSPAVHGVDHAEPKGRLDEAMAVMREVGAGMRADAAWGGRILDEVELVGVERWADSAVILRCRVKVVGIEQWNVRREFLRRLKKAYDARGIEIPFPHLTVYPGAAKDGSAPALNLRRL